MIWCIRAKLVSCFSVSDGNDSVKHKVKKELSCDGVFQMKEFPTGMVFGLCVFVLPWMIKDLDC